MFGFIRRAFFPDPLRDYVRDDVLIVGARASGAVTILEIIKSVNGFYVGKDKIELTPSYNPSINVMRSSFGLPVSVVQEVESKYIDGLGDLHFRPTKKGVTIAIRGIVESDDYDRLVMRAIESIEQNTYHSGLMLLVYEFDKLSSPTASRLAQLSTQKGVSIVAHCETACGITANTIDMFDMLLVTRVRDMSCLTFLNEYFPLGSADSRELLEGNTGVYHLFCKGGRYTRDRVKAL
ncbi:hypothetical protein VCHA53O466_50485 [Vibrio chagasii]|nr:hypothetical protein VCHA53O466_50485 [Vibrio chagasii]